LPNILRVITPDALSITAFLTHKIKNLTALSIITINA